MAATDRLGRRLVLALVAVPGLVLVLVLVAVGPCLSSAPDRPIPPPALAGLALRAVVDGDEIVLTVRLDPDAERGIEVPGRSTSPVWGDVSAPLLAHRGRLAEGGVVLAVGRGRIVAEPGPRPRVSVPDVPILIEPGDEVDLEAVPVETPYGRDQPETASAAELRRADTVWVCLWGILRNPADPPSRVSDPLTTRQLACVEA